MSSKASSKAYYNDICINHSQFCIPFRLGIIARAGVTQKIKTSFRSCSSALALTSFCGRKGDSAMAGLIGLPQQKLSIIEVEQLIVQHSWASTRIVKIH